MIDKPTDRVSPGQRARRKASLQKTFRELSSSGLQALIERRGSMYSNVICKSTHIIYTYSYIYICMYIYTHKDLHTYRYTYSRALQALPYQNFVAHVECHAGIHGPSGEVVQDCATGGHTQRSQIL